MIGGIPARIRTEPELAHRVPVILGSRNLVLEAIKQGYKEADLNRRVDRIDQFLSKQDDQDALSADLEREMRRRSGRRL